MSFRQVQVPVSVPGGLWLDAMPGRFEPWPAFEARAQRARLALVVCLTPRTELQQLSPAYHAALAEGRMAFRWVNLPIRNFGVPEDPAAFRAGVADIARSLREGHGVLLHCAAGIGRTGSTAACVLKALGVPAEEALRQVRAAGSNPENAQQSGLVDWF